MKMDMMTKIFRLFDIEIANNPVPAFDQVLEYWHVQRGQKFAPSWAAFDLMAIPTPLLPYCVVVDLQPPPLPIRYRYFGSGIANSHGFEMTNKTSDDIHPVALRNHIVGQYQAIVACRTPRLFASEIYVKWGIRLQDIVLRLPLSDDGETVSNVITFEHQDNNGDAFQDVSC